AERCPVVEPQLPLRRLVQAVDERRDVARRLDRVHRAERLAEPSADVVVGRQRAAVDPNVCARQPEAGYLGGVPERWPYRWDRAWHGDAGGAGAVLEGHGPFELLAPTLAGDLF